MNIGIAICSCYVPITTDSKQQIKEPMVSRIGRPGVGFKFIQERAPSGSVEVKHD
jgi:hypothetical protein